MSGYLPCRKDSWHSILLAVTYVWLSISGYEAKNHAIQMVILCLACLAEVGKPSYTIYSLRISNYLHLLISSYHGVREGWIRGAAMMEIFPVTL